MSSAGLYIESEEKCRAKLDRKMDFSGIGFNRNKESILLLLRTRRFAEDDLVCVHSEKI